VLVESVIQALAPEKVTLLTGAEEDVSFTLPRELRQQYPHLDSDI
jgi:hypothetical protein